MADANVANKKFLKHEVVGNVRMDLVEFTIPDGTTGSVVETRLSRILAMDVCGQDIQRRNIFLLPNTPSGGSVTIASWAGGAADNNKKILCEVWGW